MNVIKLLDELTINQIAAGEVIDKPASVIKELIENSLDANANVINIRIKSAGIKFIEISDNGMGMTPEDIKVSILRHATSKITNLEDLNRILSMGFRGEALASISAVSLMTIKSKKSDSDYGYSVSFDSGKIIKEGITSVSNGTIITIENLFYNTPARYKFLKKDSTETSYISDIVERFVLSRPEVSFRLYNEDNEIIHSPGNNDLKSAIFSIYGKEFVENIIPVDYSSSSGIIVTGYIGKTEIFKKNRSYQSVFINHRYIKSITVTTAVEEALKTRTMKTMFPCYILNLEINPSFLDVNVHPQKTTVKFQNEGEVFKAVYHAIELAYEEGYNTIKIDSVVKSSIRSIAEINNVNEKYVEYAPNPDIKTTPSIKHIEQPPHIENVQETKKSNNDINIQQTLYDLHKNDSKSSMITSEHNEKNKENSMDIKKNQSSYVICDTYEDNGLLLSEKILIYLYNFILLSKENKNNSSLVPRIKFVGTIFKTFILFECDKLLLLIDQHAAHERIIFERIIQGDFKHESSQLIISPIILNLTATEKLIFDDVKSILYDAGFDLEYFSDKSIVIRSIPSYMHIDNAVESIRLIINRNFNSNTGYEEKYKEVVYQIACKSAIKANDDLHNIEIQNLLNYLSETPNSYHCPHGRPVITLIKQEEIYKLFKRIL